MDSIAGKRIIVTGASKGLGCVVAASLADAGAKLVLMARSQEKLENVRKSLLRSETHLSLPIDFQEISKISGAVLEALSFLSGIDCVVHVAGGGLGLKSDLIENSDFLKLLNLNLAAAIEINRLVVPEMRQQKSGNLVHVGSIASIEAVGSVGYNTVKAALSAYVRSIGRAFAADGIIASGIMPGGFLAPESAMERMRLEKPEVYQKFIEERLPRKKIGEATELTPLLLFLCSPQAGMMAGCMVPCDGAEGRSY